MANTDESKTGLKVNRNVKIINAAAEKPFRPVFGQAMAMDEKLWIPEMPSCVRNVFSYLIFV